MNAIDDVMPSDLKDAIAQANDDFVHVVILDGAGRTFCSGDDLEQFAEMPRPTLGSQDMLWDPMIDYQFMAACTDAFMS